MSNIIPTTPSTPQEGPQPADRPKKKRGRPPANVDAQNAIQTIANIQEEKDKDNIEKENRRLEIEAQKKLEILNQIKINEVKEKIKRKIRAAEQKRLEKEKQKIIISDIEKSFGKIKWKSTKSGYLIKGFYEDKLIFEIKRTLVFNLYVKDKTLMEKHSFKQAYVGCSMFIKALKERSENLL